MRFVAHWIMRSCADPDDSGLFPRAGIHAIMDIRKKRPTGGTHSISVEGLFPVEGEREDEQRWIL